MQALCAIKLGESLNGLARRRPSRHRERGREDEEGPTRDHREGQGPEDAASGPTADGPQRHPSIVNSRAEVGGGKAGPVAQGVPRVPRGTGGSRTDTLGIASTVIGVPASDPAPGVGQEPTNVRQRPAAGLRWQEQRAPWEDREGAWTEWVRYGGRVHRRFRGCGQVQGARSKRPGLDDILPSLESAVGQVGLAEAGGQ